MSSVGTSIGLFTTPINLLNNLNYGPSNIILYKECRKNNKKNICDQRFINVPPYTFGSGPGIAPFYFPTATTGRVVLPNIS